MVTTTCSKCGSIEHTLASVKAKCMYCKDGIMLLVSMGDNE